MAIYLSSVGFSVLVCKMGIISLPRGSELIHASLVAQMVKNLPQCERPGLDPWLGRSPAGGHGNRLQYWRTAWRIPWTEKTGRVWGRKESGVTERLTLD